MTMKKTDADAILDQAVGLFREKGYRSTSMADIGKAAGLLKGSVYHHFPSKEAILMGAVDRLADFFQETCFSVAYNERRAEADRLHEMIDLIETYFLEHRSCVMAYLSIEGLDEMPDAYQKVTTFFRFWRNSMAHVLESRYGHDAALALAEDAIAQMEGAVVMLNIFDDTGSLTRACTNIKALL